MRKPCIVKQLLTMQGFFIFWPPFLIFRPGGLRTKTEFIGFAGRRTQTAPAPGPPFLIFMARGSRKETEFIGFAGSQARTAPAPGPPLVCLADGFHDVFRPHNGNAGQGKLAVLLR